MAFEDRWQVDSSQYDWNDDYIRISAQLETGPGTSPSGSIVAHYQFSQFELAQPLAVSPSVQANGIPIIPDTMDGTSVDSNNLVIVTLYGTPNSTEYLTRSSDSIDIYGDQGAAGAILGTTSMSAQPPTNEAPISFDATGTRVVWLGWDGSTEGTTGSSGEATLTISAQAPNQGPLNPIVLAQAGGGVLGPGWGQPDQLKVQETHKLVVGIAGHTQSLGPNHPWELKQCGTFEIATQLRPQYAVRLFPEDPGNTGATNTTKDGQGVTDPQNGALAFVQREFNNDGVLHLAMYGYSHGGGSVYLLSKKLADPANAPKNYLNAQGQVQALEWTGYIDAIAIDPGVPVLSTFAETHLPVGTKSHFNRWQSVQSVESPAADAGLHGAATALPAGINIPVDQKDMDVASLISPTNNLDHTNRRGLGIAESRAVQAGLIGSLKGAMPA